MLCAAFACLVHAAEEPSPPARYAFNYAVNEPITGDQKDQQETRDGDNVDGFYRTVDADGFLRTVKYKADAVNGFTAEVTREPINGATPAVAKAVVKPAPVPLITPAPVVVKAPVAPAPAPVPYYFGSSGYPYNYQPSYQQYSYGYQPYSYGYQPYSYGYQSYPYAYSYNQYPYGQYSPTAF